DHLPQLGSDFGQLRVGRGQPRYRPHRRGASLSWALVRLAVIALLLSPLPVTEAGTIVILQHQPGDSSRPWTWRRIINQLPMIRAAGYTAILLSPHQQACG